MSIFRYRRSTRSWLRCLDYRIGYSDSEGFRLLHGDDTFGVITECTCYDTNGDIKHGNIFEISLNIIQVKPS